MKVLVAEDDPNILRGIVEVLEGEGYSPIAARDGAEALQLFESQRPDFVCLDIMMPKVNGYDVCKKIRARSEGVPIMFLSAKSEEIDRVLGLELGADDYLMKPFGVRELAARIRAVARRCRRRDTGRQCTRTRRRQVPRPGAARVLRALLARPRPPASTSSTSSST